MLSFRNGGAHYIINTAMVRKWQWIRTLRIYSFNKPYDSVCREIIIFDVNVEPSHR
jgi:hypothetical protein